MALQMPDQFHPRPLARAQLQTRTSWYQGSEKDDEVTGTTQSHFTTYFREGDTRLARWWGIDPKANLTPWESPYVLMGNNPVVNTDIMGDQLDVDKNRKSKRDVKRLASIRNRKYIRIDKNGAVSMDFGRLSKEKIQKKISSDKGLGLINKIVNANEKYLYQATDKIQIRDESGARITGVTFINHYLIINASNNGYDSNWKHEHRPQDGYDGQVIISPRAIFSENGPNGSVRKSRSSLVFHELYENYMRTTHGVSYQGFEGAHQYSILMEYYWNRRYYTPGIINDVTKVRIPSKVVIQKMIDSNIKYLNYVP